MNKTCFVDWKTGVGMEMEVLYCAKFYISNGTT